MEKVVKGLQDDLAHEDAIISSKTANGEVITPDDYNLSVGIVQDIAMQKRNYADARYAKWYENKNNMLMSQSDRQTLYNEWILADTEALQAEADLAEKKKVQVESSVNEINKRIEDDEATAAKFQASIKKAEANDRHVGDATYEILSSTLTKQANEQRNLYDEYMQLAQNNPEFASQFQQSASSALETAIDLDEQAFEAKVAPITNYIDDLVNKGVDGYTAFNTLQRDATEIENELNEADAKHQKTTEDLYDKLIKNGDKQISNLQKQREKWRDLQNEVGYGSSKWREYQSEIDSIDDSINTMRQNQLGWTETMTSIVSTNAAELSSALSSAFGEINSETGLTIDTMNELERQFSDLAGYDVSDIFYRSADGMKFNTAAAEALIDAEYDLQTNNLFDAISRQKYIIDQLSDSESANAQATIASAEQRIDAYNRELAMLQAQYDQQKDLLSARSQWENAQQTENAGANYESVQGYLKTQQEAYDKGLTGTDEFKAYTAYFDQWGMNTVAAWERNKDKVVRYMTEDSSGLSNFLNDLVTEGLATKDENGMFTLNLGDQAAAAAQMGMSQEWFNDILSRSEDYGFINRWVDSELDGMMQMEELTNKLIEETLRLNEVRRDGADQDVIDNQQQRVDEIQAQIDQVKTATDVVRENKDKISAADIRNNVEDVNGLIEDMYNAEPEQFETYMNQIQAFADDNHVKLKINAETGKIEVDEEAMQEAFPEYDVPIKPDWEALDEMAYGKPKEIKEFADGVQTPVELQAQMEAQEVDQTLVSAVEKVKNGWDENNTALMGYLDTLSNYSEEDLKKITLSDGEYNVEENMHGAEDALQNIADMFGLSAEEGTKLLQILKEIGLFDGTLMGEETYTLPQSLADTIRNITTAGMNAAEQFKGTETGDFASATVQKAETGLSSVVQEFANNVKEQVKDDRIQQETQPITDALTSTNSAISDAASSIVTAITSIPSEIASAITGQSSEQPNVVEVSSAPANPDLRGALSGSSNPGIGPIAALAPPSSSDSSSTTAAVQQVSLKPDSTELDQKKAEIESTPIVQKIDLQTTDASVNKPESQTVTNTVKADTSSAEASMNRLANMEDMSSQINITAKDDTSAGIQSANASVEQGVKDKTIDLNARDNISPVANAAQGSINGVQGKNVSLDISVNGLSEITNAKKEIQDMKDKRVVVTTVNKHVTEALGTATVSFASGTAYGKWETYRHSIGAYANGTSEDWELKASESALVNEFAPNHPESIVRNGKWMIIPGGPHVEQLKKGDIIYIM